MGQRAGLLMGFVLAVMGCSAEALPEEIHSDDVDKQFSIANSLKTFPPPDGSLQTALAFAHPYVTQRVVKAFDGFRISDLWARVYAAQPARPGPVVLDRRFDGAYHSVALWLVEQRQYVPEMKDRLRITGRMSHADVPSQTCKAEEPCRFSFRVEFDPPEQVGEWPSGVAPAYRTYIKFTTDAIIKHRATTLPPVRVVRENGAYVERPHERIGHIPFDAEVFVIEARRDGTLTRLAPVQCNAQLKQCVDEHGAGLSCFATNPCNDAVGALTCDGASLRGCVIDALRKLEESSNPHGGALAKTCLRNYCEASAVGPARGFR